MAPLIVLASCGRSEDAGSENNNPGSTRGSDDSQRSEKDTTPPTGPGDQEKTPQRPQPSESDTWASTDSAHGGHVVQCPDRVPVVLDFHHAMLPTTNHPAPQVNLGDSVESALDTFRSLLREFPFHEQFEGALEKVGHPYDWTLAPLPLLPNPSLIYNLPEGCTLHQAAVRQDGVLYLDPHWRDTLALSQLGMLWVHEALVQLGIDNGGGSLVTPGVRNLIATWLRIDRDPLAFANRLTKFGMRYSNSSYKPLNGNSQLRDKSTQLLVKSIRAERGADTGKVFHVARFVLFLEQSNGRAYINATCSPQSTGDMFCTGSDFSKVSQAGVFLRGGGKRLVFVDEMGQETGKVYTHN